MKKHFGRVGMAWAALLTAIAATMAVAVDVNTGTELEAELGNPNTTSIKLAPGTYELPGPVDISRTLTIQGAGAGVETELPTQYVIMQAAGGNCMSGVVKSPGFEPPASDWIEKISATDLPNVVTPVITTDGSPTDTQHAWFRVVEPTATANPVQELGYTCPALPNPLVEILTWPSVTIPKVLPDPFRLKYKLDTLTLAPSITQTVNIDNITLAVSETNILLWFKKIEAGVNPNFHITVTGPTIKPPIDTDLNMVQKGGPWYAYPITGLSQGLYSIKIVFTCAASSPPPLYLLGRIQTNPSAVNGEVDPGTITNGTKQDLSGLLCSTIPATIDGYPLDGFMIGTGPETVTTEIADRNVIRFGGILDKPRLTFKVKAPRINPDASVYDKIVVNGPTVAPANLIYTANVSAACKEFEVSVTGPGEIWFDVYEKWDPVAGKSTVFVLDDLSLSYFAPSLGVAPTPLPNGNFEAGAILPWMLEFPNLEPTVQPLTIADVIVDTFDACSTSKAARFSLDNVKATLAARMKAPKHNGADELVIKVDGVALTDGAINSATSATYAGWNDMSADVIPFADGLKHTVTFESTTATNIADPTVFLLEGAEIQVGAPPITAATMDLTTVGLIPLQTFGLPMLLQNGDLTDNSKPEVVRFGGLGQPRLNFNYKMPTKGNATDKLEVLLDGTNVWSMNIIEEPGCVPVAPSPFIYPTNATPSLVLRATISDEPSPQPAPSVIVVDDVSLVAASDIFNTASVSAVFYSKYNALVSGDFDSDNSNWSANPAGIIGSSDNCSAPNAAVFKAGLGTTFTTIALEQAITKIPANAGDLEFYYRKATDAPGGEVEFFRCYIKTELSPTFTLAWQAALGGAPNTDTKVTVPLTAYQGQSNVMLKFEAKLAVRKPAISVALDELCVMQAANNGPVLSVSAGALTLEGLTLHGGSRSLAVNDASSLIMNRCLLDSGLDFNGKGGATVASSVFSGGSPAVICQGAGALNLFQSTVHPGDVVSKSGTVNIGACIVDGSLKNTGGSMTACISWIGGAKQGVTEQNLLDIAVTGPVPYIDSPWPGKLDVTAPKIALFRPTGTGACASGGDQFDFESQLRGGSAGQGLMVGADEVDGPNNPAGIWVGCTITPKIAGPDDTVTVQIQTADLPVMGCSLLLVPEWARVNVVGSTDYPTGYAEIPITASTTNPFSVTVDLGKFNAQDGVWPKGGAMCTEGRNTIWLKSDDGAGNVTIYEAGLAGSGEIAPSVYALDADGHPNNSFLVDTAAPKLTGVAVSSVSSPVFPCGNIYNFFNDGAAAETAPYSTSLPAGSLGFTVMASFVDAPPPRVDTRIETAGFRRDRTISADAAALVTRPDASLRGLARWSDGKLNLGAGTGTLNVDAVNGTCTWDINNVSGQGVEGLIAQVKPLAMDAAGNESAMDATWTKEIYWLWRVRAILPTSSLAGAYVETPDFEWALYNHQSIPSGCGASAASYKLWVTEGNLYSANTRWDTVQDWSGYAPGSPLGGAAIKVLLANTNLKGKAIMITVLGRDEAGNEQYVGSGANNSVTWGELQADEIAYDWWHNGPGQENVAVDTAAQVELGWKVGLEQNDKNIEPFAGASRVPLPPLAESSAGKRVIANVNLTAKYQGSLLSGAASSAVNNSDVWIAWKLLEDGALVASGKVYTVGSCILRFPDVLLYTPDEVVLDDPAMATAFLNTGPGGGAKNRLGDEGPAPNYRKREVRYTLIAQTVASVPHLDSVGNQAPSVQVVDPSPASVEFSIYSPDFDDTIRDERPVRSYERK